MFEPETMSRVQIVVLARDERAVWRGLGELGAVELRASRAGTENAPVAPPDRAGEISRCEKLLARLEDLRRSLGVPTISEASLPAPGGLDRIEERLREMECRAKLVLEPHRRLSERLRELTWQSDQASSLRELDLPLDRMRTFDFLHFVIGTVPEGELGRLSSAVGPGVVLLPLGEQGGRQVLGALSAREGAHALQEALDRAGFRPEKLPEVDVEGETPEALCERCGREREELTVALGRADARRRALGAELARPTSELRWLLREERQLLEAQQSCPRTASSVLITGWVPAADTAKLERRVREITTNRCALAFTAPSIAPEEEVPVLLKHPWPIRPFELLVSAYGLPKYRELSPTLFVAVSYVLMFGLMFGDVGHGAVLASLSLIPLLNRRLSKRLEIGLLLLANGGSSMLFGALYGSYFGLPGMKEYALWHDPLEGDPVALMLLAIGFGVAMISLGLLLNVINRLRRRELWSASMDKFGLAGIWFYWGALALACGFTALPTGGWRYAALSGLLLLPMLCWVIKDPVACLRARRKQGRDGRGGVAAVLLESVVGAFEGVLLYLANTVSFVRLAAYAMSHAALLMAAFTMAAQVKRLGAAGEALGVLVIVAGNAIAIALEGVVASVQALRLEYYEFFGKFFSGDGRAFRPFTLPAAVGP